MDRLILTFFNQTLAHPFLDGVMLGFTWLGLASLPALGVVLTRSTRQRRVGIAILAALCVGFAMSLSFQYLILRPRPDNVRLIIDQPHFPSYPSGHATAAFSAALIIVLSYRSSLWRIAALSIATLIALSRVYLGLHYPSDIIAGAFLGGAIGTTYYGLIVSRNSGWHWLLWLQIVLALMATHMGYLQVFPAYLLDFPWADKILHFFLIGSIAFWLNLWLKGRAIWSIPLAILVPLTIALLEEGLQLYSPFRTASFLDLSSDMLGLLVFWWLSRSLLLKTHVPEMQPCLVKEPTLSRLKKKR